MQSPAVTAKPPEMPRPRLAYIDNLRIALTALVVLHHSAMPYGNIPLWYYLEDIQGSSGVALDIFVIVNQAFFMGFFFMIAGFFTPGSFDRKGSRSFWRDRLVRLGIPLLLFLLVLRPGVTSWIYANFASDVPYWLFYIVSWDPGPMWFVEVLLVFCLGYMLIRRLRPRTETTSAAVDDQPSGLPGPLAIMGFTLGLALVSYVWRAVIPSPHMWPIIGLPTPGFLPQYLGLFIVGVYAYRRGWFAYISPRVMWSGLAVAVPSLLVFLVSAGVKMDQTLSLWHPIQLVNVVAEMTFAVAIILFGLGLFQRRFNTQGPFGRFLSKHAFAVYFIHPLVLVGIGYALGWWESIAVVKFAVAAIIALPACWLVAWGIRSLPKAKKVF